MGPVPSCPPPTFPFLPSGHFWSNIFLLHLKCQRNFPSWTVGQGGGAHTLGGAVENGDELRIPGPKNDLCPENQFQTWWYHTGCPSGGSASDPPNLPSPSLPPALPPSPSPNRWLRRRWALPCIAIGGGGEVGKANQRFQKTSPGGWRGASPSSSESQSLGQRAGARGRRGPGRYGSIVRWRESWRPQSGLGGGEAVHCLGG